MSSNPSAASLDFAWQILQCYPALHWSKAALAETFAASTTVAFGNGFAVALFSKVLDEAELLLIATHPTHLKQGHASALLTSCLKALEPCTVFLEVRASNLAAQALYSKLGFIPYRKRPRYYQDGEDALLFKRIAP